MIFNTYKKRFALLFIISFLFVGIVSVQAAETVVGCGVTKNTRYSTIVGDDLYQQQSTSGDWRHGGTTLVYVKDNLSNEQAYKGLSSGTRHVYVYVGRPSRTRFHDHWATDHQE